jgi:hypothetical protein
MGRKRFSAAGRWPACITPPWGDALRPGAVRLTTNRVMHLAKPPFGHPRIDFGGLIGLVIKILIRPRLLFPICSRLPCPDAPAFRASHLLSDWPSCQIEIHCCRGVTIIPIRRLMLDHGDPTFSAVIGRLRCKRCHGAPAPVYLCAGGREWTGGPPADWAIEVVPKRQ